MTENKKEIGSIREHPSAFIYFGGFYTMFNASICNIMGQNPCLSLGLKGDLEL
jgi:hypothetical protein